MPTSYDAKPPEFVTNLSTNELLATALFPASSLEYFTPPNKYARKLPTRSDFNLRDSGISNVVVCTVSSNKVGYRSMALVASKGLPLVAWYSYSSKRSEKTNMGVKRASK